MKYLYPAKEGRWKYLRDVPKRLQTVLGRKRWEYSLGSNRTEALRKWARYSEEHDTLIASLSTDDAVSEYQNRRDSEQAAEAARTQTALLNRPGIKQYAGIVPELSDLWRPDTPREDWRQTERVMKDARSDDPKQEWKRLAHFAGYAFGDRAHLNELTPEERDPFQLMLADAATCTPPSDPTAQAIYEANHIILNGRLAELSPYVSPDAPDRILKFYARFADFKSHKELTRVDYEKKLKDFVDRVGDLRIGEVTREHLKTYRDGLSKRMKEVSSVVGYMGAIKALLAYAFDEDEIPTNPAAGLKMPSDPKSIEDRKHLPFKPSQVLMILEKIHTVWADENSKSKLSLGRRRLYRLTIEALLHTGARPHELWRLAPSDAGTHEAHNWHQRGIDIRNTKDGARLIPCPDKALPFADFVQNGGLSVLQAENEKEIANRIKAFSGERQFGKILTDLNIKRPRVSLYSTRATFVSALQRNGYGDGMIENIIGHVGSARMLRHYKSPEEMDDMLAAMQSVSYR
ncbi:phage integrase SAM-like domain-containing protein [Pseudoruegeria sp. HB172150]|uniref:phage integrase SAM-like domain-containing protein n=1 Tax=Pseudoruegeria sp. HB172150 TaxID=2721164 RepID=UPI001C131C56